jgi:hypothetical protein
VAGTFSAIDFNRAAGVRERTNELPRYPPKRFQFGRQRGHFSNSAKSCGNRGGRLSRHQIQEIAMTHVLESVLKSVLKSVLENVLENVLEIVENVLEIVSNILNQLASTFMQAAQAGCETRSLHR